MRERRSLAATARLLLLGAGGALAWAVLTGAPAVADDGMLDAVLSEDATEVSPITDAVVSTADVPAPVVDVAEAIPEVPVSVPHEVVPVVEAVPVTDAVASVTEEVVQRLEPVEAVVSGQVIQPVVGVVEAASGTVAEVVPAPLPLDVVEEIVPAPSTEPIPAREPSEPLPSMPVLPAASAEPATTPLTEAADDGAADLAPVSPATVTVASSPLIDEADDLFAEYPPGHAASSETRPAMFPPGGGVIAGSAITVAVSAVGAGPGNVPESWSLQSTLPGPGETDGTAIPPSGPAYDPGSTPD